VRSWNNPLRAGHFRLIWQSIPRRRIPDGW
jgi:hypothetical protein